MGVTFLSDAWFEKVDELTRATQMQVPREMESLILNITARRDGGDVQFRLEHGHFKKGHSAGADAAITLPESFVKRMFFLNEPGAGAEAFLTNQARVEGDVGKIMELQWIEPTDGQRQFLDRILDL